MLRNFAVACALISVLAFLCCARAQEPQAGPAPPTVSPSSPADPAVQAADAVVPPPPAPLPAPPRAIADATDLSAYVDGLVDQAMERDGIAGVTWRSSTATARCCCAATASPGRRRPGRWTRAARCSVSPRFPRPSPICSRCS